MKGTAAMQLAASWGKSSTVCLLPEAGAEVNGMLDPKDFDTLNERARQTALHAAAEAGYGKVVEYLIEQGADSKKVRYR